MRMWGLGRDLCYCFWLLGVGEERGDEVELVGGILVDDPNGERRGKRGRDRPKPLKT